METPQPLSCENNNEIFGNLLAVLESEFADQGFNFELTPTAHSGQELRISGTCDISADFQEKLHSIFEEHGFIAKFVGKGNHSCNFFLDRKMIEGKVNWRGWFNTPEEIPAESQTILDAIAGLPEIAQIAAKREDTLGKISSFLNLAVRSGVITQNEYHDLFNDVKSKGNLR